MFKVPKALVTVTLIMRRDSRVSKNMADAPVLQSCIFSPGHVTATRPRAGFERRCAAARGVGHRRRPERNRLPDNYLAPPLAAGVRPVRAGDDTRRKRRG